MGMTDNLLSTSQWLITAVLFAVILLNAVRSVDWSALRKDNALQHSFFGAAVILGFVWQLRAGISPGLAIHIFGITVITLMLGWALAVLAGLLALVITVITGREPLLMFAANGLRNMYHSNTTRVFDADMEDLLHKNPEWIVLLAGDGAMSKVEPTFLSFKGAKELKAVKKGHVVTMSFALTDPPTPLTITGTEKLHDLIKDKK